MTFISVSHYRPIAISFILFVAALRLLTPIFTEYRFLAGRLKRSLRTHKVGSAYRPTYGRSRSFDVKNRMTRNVGFGQPILQPDKTSERYLHTPTQCELQRMPYHPTAARSHLPSVNPIPRATGLGSLKSTSNRAANGRSWRIAFLISRLSCGC